MRRSACLECSAYVAIAATAVGAIGCSRGPTAVAPPPIDAAKAAAALIAQYDKSGDGALQESEVAASPAVADAMKSGLDQDNDRALSREEVQTRFEKWVGGGVGASSLSCRVTLAGKPLAGAVVRLIPEAALEGMIQPATGTTNAAGTALLAMDAKNLPADLQNLKAVQQGLYRVEITHDQVPVPAKYNTSTTLGVEVSFDSGRNFLQFKL